MTESDFNTFLHVYAHAHKVDPSKILPDELKLQTVTTLEFTVDVPKVSTLDSGLMIKVWHLKVAGDYAGVEEIFRGELGFVKLNEFVSLDLSDRVDVINTWVGSGVEWNL